MPITHYLVFSNHVCKSDAIPAIRCTLILCFIPKIKYVGSHTITYSKSGIPLVNDSILRQNKHILSSQVQRHALSFKGHVIFQKHKYVYLFKITALSLEFAVSEFALHRKTK